MPQTTDQTGFRVTLNGSGGSVSYDFVTSIDGLDEAGALRLAAAFEAAQMPAPMSFEIDKIVGSKTVSYLDTSTNPPSWT